MAWLNVSTTFGFAGPLNPMWLSLTWAKRSVGCAAGADELPATCDFGIDVFFFCFLASCVYVLSLGEPAAKVVVQRLGFFDGSVRTWNAELELLESLGYQFPPLIAELLDHQAHPAGFCVEFGDLPLGIFPESATVCFGLGERLLCSILRRVELLGLAFRLLDDLQRLPPRIDEQGVHLLVRFFPDKLRSAVGGDQNLTDGLLHRYRFA